MGMKGDSIWLSGMVLAGLCHGAACAKPAAAHPTSGGAPAAISTADYQLPGPALTLAPDTPGLSPEYGDLVELKTPTAQAIATEDRPFVIPGPDLNYRAGTRGPLVEIAALGGGMDSAPSLAHVGVDWVF